MSSTPLAQVNHEHYTTRAQARGSIFEYIEVFYHRKRLHRSIGYMSPEAFEASLNESSRSAHHSWGWDLAQVKLARLLEIRGLQEGHRRRGPRPDSTTVIHRC